MRSRVQKWGNSLAVRIPAVFASELELVSDSEVEISREASAIKISPVTRVYCLDELLAGITEENRHDEMDSGPAVGAEAW